MTHPYAKQLAYALDVNFENCTSLKEVQVKASKEVELTLNALEGTGVIIKVNSIFRLLGSIAPTAIAKAGFSIFADYKLFDVQSTLINDASWLRYIPSLEILTVSEHVHPIVFQKFAELLPNTTIAPINPLTDLSDAEFKRRGEKSRAHATKAFFKRVSQLPSEGVICSPKDFPLMPAEFRFEKKIITPGIRPSWASVHGDTNAVNALTHQEAIIAGSDILVVGSPLRHNGDLRGNTIRLLDEMGETFEKRTKS